MTQREALEQIIKDNTRTAITAEEAGRACGLSGQNIRIQAREDAKNGTNNLGFRCIVAGNRVQVLRDSFLKFMEVET